MPFFDQTPDLNPSTPEGIALAEDERKKAILSALAGMQQQNVPIQNYGPLNAIADVLLKGTQAYKGGKLAADEAANLRAYRDHSADANVTLSKTWDSLDGIIAAMQDKKVGPYVQDRAQKRIDELGKTDIYKPAGIDKPSGASVYKNQYGEPKFGPAPSVGSQVAASMTEDDYRYAARMLRSGQPVVGLGRSGQAMQKVYHYAREQAIEEGHTAEADILHIASSRGTQPALNELTKRNAMLETNAAVAERNFQSLEKLSAKVDRTGAPLANRIKQAFQTNGTPVAVSQDPDLAALQNAVYESTVEYAKVVTGQTTGQAVTDAARAEVQKLIHASDAPEAFAAELSTMREFIANRREESGKVRAMLLQSMGTGQEAPGAAGNTVAPAAGTPAGAVRAPGAAAAAKPGKFPPTNAKGWKLHADAQGNQAYVSPDGKSFEPAQ